MGIPKKIHYVWLGDRPLPERDAGFVEGWRKMNSGWEVIGHGLEGFPVEKYPLVGRALEEKRWALAADIIRMWVIFREGGIYLDTDVELLKGLDFLLKYDGFGAYESKFWFTTSVFGAIAGSPWVEKILRRYEGLDEKISNDTFMKTVHSPSVYAKDVYGVVLDGETREWDGGRFATLASEVFAPKHYMTGEMRRTRETVAVHHYASTWQNAADKAKVVVSKTARKSLGVHGYEKFERAYARRMERLIRRDLA